MRESWDTPTMRWMQTYTGKVIEIADPKPCDIVIEDIAHALTRLCRYGGHVASWYSVAGHSLAMAQFAETLVDEAMLEALLHDAAEAYLGDTISPVRKLLSDEARRSAAWQVEKDQSAFVDEQSMLERLHQRYQGLIAAKFKLRDSVTGTVHLLDRLALMAEIPLVFGTVSPAFAMNGYGGLRSEERVDSVVSKMSGFVEPYVGRGSYQSIEKLERLELDFLDAFVRWERKS
jgi:5'-deoxynucleotidase YfbR-like HD superfamily hydrolase